MSVQDLWVVQLGQETARGTAVDPTAKLMGVNGAPTLRPMEESRLHDELRGSLQPGFNASQDRQQAMATLPMEVSYEDVLYPFQMLFDEDDSPSGTGPYTWDWEAPNGAQPEPQPFTVALGDGYGGSYGYGLAGALATELTLRAETGAPTTLSASLLGTRVATDTLAELSDRAVNFVLGHHWKLYIDAVGGTIGTTLLDATAFSFELAVQASRANKFHLGSLGPTGVRDRKWAGSLRLMLELTTATGISTDDYIADVLGSSPLEKQIRLKASSGTKVLQIDFAGVLLEAPELFSDQDGVVSYSANFAAKYNAQLANWLKVRAVNDVSALA